MTACGVSFHGCSVQVGDALTVVLSNGFTLNISANIDVAEDGLPDELGLGAVGFIANLTNLIHHGFRQT